MICVVLAILWISGLGFDVCFSVIGLRRLFVFLVASLPGSCWCDLLLVSWVSCSSVWVWVLFWWFGFAGCVLCNCGCGIDLDGFGMVVLLLAGWVCLVGGCGFCFLDFG